MLLRESRVEEDVPVWFPAVVWLGYGLGAAFTGATYRWWEPVWSVIAVDVEVRWLSAALALPIVIVAIAASTVIVRWRQERATA